MVEKLTEKNLSLEEIVATLEEEKADLEAINEMNEELQVCNWHYYHLQKEGRSSGMKRPFSQFKVSKGTV